MSEDKEQVNELFGFGEGYGADELEELWELYVKQVAHHFKDQARMSFGSSIYNLKKQADVFDQLVSVFKKHYEENTSQLLANDMAKIIVSRGYLGDEHLGVLKNIAYKLINDNYPTKGTVASDARTSELHTVASEIISSMGEEYKSSRFTLNLAQEDRTWFDIGQAIKKKDAQAFAKATAEHIDIEGANPYLWGDDLLKAIAKAFAKRYSLFGRLKNMF